MRILYGYSNCTDSAYNRIAGERGVYAMVPDQKYHGLLIKGLAENGAEVRCFSGLPVNRSVTARRIVSEPNEREGNAYFHYITTVNLPVLRQLMIFCGAFFGVLRTKKDMETYAVCDFLNMAVAMGFILACKLKRIKAAAVVTDLPDMFDTGKARKIIGNFILRRFNGYIFLTEHMRSFVAENAPYIVLEGHADKDIAALKPDFTYEEKSGKRVVMYAGNIHGKYGIANLAEGFVMADIPDSELWVNGRGDYTEALTELCREHPAISYMGQKPNSEIVAEELRAALLVNPRPTAPEYTKYSFPSKNMEYMASGTPLLTTRLPGMPAEYEPYVYLIDDDSAAGIADALKKVFADTPEERRAKGAAARAFVLEKKSNVVQAGKIIKFLKDTFS